MTIIRCACGCGQVVGVEKRFIHGHNRRLSKEKRILNRKANLARWKEKNPETFRRINRESQKRGRDRLAEFKNVPCKDCGKRFPTECMDFDHIRGEKRANLSQIAAYSMKIVMEEIAKCDVVCANCHRIRTHRRQLERAA